MRSCTMGPAGVGGAAPVVAGTDDGRDGIAEGDAVGVTDEVIDFEAVAVVDAFDAADEDGVVAVDVVQAVGAQPGDVGGVLAGGVGVKALEQALGEGVFGEQVAQVVIENDGTIGDGEFGAGGEAVRVEVVVVAQVVDADGRANGVIDVLGAQGGVEEVVDVVELAGEFVGGGQAGAGGADLEALALGLAGGVEEGAVLAVVELGDEDGSADGHGIGAVAGGGVEGGAEGSGSGGRAGCGSSWPCRGTRSCRTWWPD